MSIDDAELVRRYVTQHSEEAFAELVRRYLDLVYRAALRQLETLQVMHAKGQYQRELEELVKSLVSASGVTAAESPQG